MTSDSRKHRKEVQLPLSLHEKLMQRKVESRLDAVDQIHLALELAFREHESGKQVMASIPLRSDDDARLPLMVTGEFWNQVKEVARAQDKNLRAFVIAALSHYFDQVNKGLTGEDGDTLSSMRRVAQEEISAALARSNLPMPPPNTGQLLASLGQWTRPQGDKYLMSGEVNAGPLRDLSDLPDAELLSDFEILEWEDQRDLMLRITEDARDGECLIYDDIFPGDILHFRCGLVPEQGEIVVAVGYDIDRKPFGTVKHYFETPNGVELRPNNPNCEPICAFKGDIEIRGVLFNLIQRNFRARMQMRRRMGVYSRPEFYRGVAQ